jgi:hypothetical protein
MIRNWHCVCVSMIETRKPVVVKVRVNQWSVLSRSTDKRKRRLFDTLCLSVTNTFLLVRGFLPKLRFSTEFLFISLILPGGSSTDMGWEARSAQFCVEQKLRMRA